MAVGMNVTAYLDYKGDIATARYTSQADGWKYGYLMNMYEDDAGDGYIVKIFTDDGESKRLPMTKKIKLNNIKVDVSSAYSYFCTAADGKILPQLIKYVDDDKEGITKIDTKEVSASEKADTSFSEDVTKMVMGIEFSKKRFYSMDANFGYTKYFNALSYDSSGIVFVVPSKLEDKRGNESLYMIYNGSSYFDYKASKQEYVTLSAYDVDKSKGDLGGAFVIEGGSKVDFGRPVVIANVEDTVSADDMPIKKISVYAYDSDTLMSYILNDDVTTFELYYTTVENDGEYVIGQTLKVPIDQLKCGDVVALNIDDANKIDTIRRYFSPAHLKDKITYYDDNGDLKNFEIPGSFIRSHGVILSESTDMGSAGGAYLSLTVGILREKYGDYISYY